MNAPKRIIRKSPARATTPAVFVVMLLALLVFPLKRGSPAGNIASKSAGSPGEKDTLQLLARKIAAGYVKGLNGTSWSMELTQWIRRHGYRGKVDTARPGQWAEWEYQHYGFHTWTEEDERDVGFSFFDNGDYLHPEAILQQVSISDGRTGGSARLKQQVWDIISDSLTKRYGPPGRVPDDDLLSPFNLDASPGELTPRFWQDGARRIVLATDFGWEGSARRDFILLLAREKALDSLIHLYRKAESQSYRGLVSEVRDSLRPLNTAFNVFCSPKDSQKTSFDDLVRCGKFVAAAGHTADSVHIPLYLLALQMYGETYIPPGAGLHDSPQIDTLKRYDIVFDMNPLGGGWAYSAKPLVSLYDRYADSHWGQIAFVLLQRTGWCLNGMCNGNYGPKVVSQGNAFLKSHPKGVLVPAVLLTVAKGYETNWDVSICDTDSPYMYDPDYRNDESARVNAIATYERIIDEYPSSVEATVAGLRLARLRLGIYNGRADYFFIYD